MAVKVRERGGAWWVFVDHRLPALVEALGDVPPGENHAAEEWKRYEAY